MNFLAIIPARYASTRFPGKPLARLGVPIIGTDVQAIRNAEDRGCFERIMEELGIPQPEAEAVTDIESGVRAAARIGYPVLVRPSYVLGGRAMQILSLIHI